MGLVPGLRRALWPGTEPSEAADLGDGTRRCVVKNRITSRSKVSWKSALSKPGVGAQIAGAKSFSWAEQGGMKS